jgi:hypothetical protein
MAYREPRLRVFQNLANLTVSEAEALYAVIIGPQFALHRYDVASEKSKIADHDRDNVNIYAWPNHVAGGVIDTSTAKIIAENCLLKYFVTGTPAALAADESNQLVFDEVIASNAAADRDLDLGTRDVKVGDVAVLNWTDGSGAHEVKTAITALIADTVPGTTDPDITRVEGFGDTASGSTELTAPPARFTTSYDVSAYDGLEDGYPLDVYSVRVTVAAVGSGAGNLDGTTLKISSDGGEETQTVVLSASNYDVPNTRYEIPLGSRGALLQIEDAGSGALNVEDTWRVSISQTYAQVDETNAAEVNITGPYTGKKNTQYIITCTKGGTLGTDDLIFTYRTNNGADSTGSINALAADFTVAQVDYAIGNKGMELSLFDTTQWNTGDIIVFDVATASVGEIHTAVLRDKIPALDTDAITVTLFVITTVELDETSYSLTQSNITVYTNAVKQHELLGTLQALEVHEGVLYADYREHNTVSANNLMSVAFPEDVDTLLGPVSPSNPLAQGAFEAVSLAQGVPVYAINVESDDLEGYTRALDVLTENNIVYSIVPLTNDADIKNLCVAHVLSRSNELNNQWRIAWLANNTSQVIGVYTAQGNDDDIVATVEDVPANGAKKVVSVGSLFATNGVLPGDILRINFDDSGDTVTYDEFIVDAVSEDELLLLTPLDAPISVAVKIEIWRSLTNAQYAAAVGTHSGSYATRRVRCIWADNYIDGDGNPKELFYLCAALAGQRSGLAPHAPMTEVAIPTAYLSPVLKLGKTDLNVMASGGTWIVVKDNTGRVYTRHQLTTENNPDDILAREDSVTTNIDHISRDYYNNTRDLLGQSNISPSSLKLINLRITDTTTSIQSRSYPANIGPQLLDLTIEKIERHPVLRDTVTIHLIPVVPLPLNQMDIILNVTA